MKKMKLKITLLSLTLSLGAYSQTNLFDDVIVPDPNLSYLETAILQQGLESALRNNSATLTLFAPTNAAFDDLATAMGTDINGVLASPDLTDILTYHVLSAQTLSSSITNGAVVQPLNTSNSIKLTLKGSGDVFANQAQVTTADLTADNGVVHKVNAVLLPVETVVDIALDNGFTSLTAAVIKAELLPALTNPLAQLTVFAPTNTAFDNLATALGVTVPDLLNLPNLADILTYHVLGSEVLSTAITNGAVVQPLSTSNTLKLTLKGNGDVFVNQAQVTSADIDAANGVVHVLNAVVLPFETVVDVAIDNGFTSLTAAVIKAELLPALTNPLAQLTVFAPTNTAFDNLATALGTDLNGVLASPDLTNILLYHVIDGLYLSSDLTNGLVETLNGENVSVDVTAGVKINSSNVTTADLEVDNGVVHVIDAVLLPAVASVEETSLLSFQVYPNPSSDMITINTNGIDYEEAIIIDLNGKVVLKSSLKNNNTLNINKLEKGTYILSLKGKNTIVSSKIEKF